MFLNRIRLPMYFSRPQFPVERSVFKRADGSRQVLSAVISNTYEGKTDDIPKEWHQKLVIALSHDTVNIESDRLLTEVVLDSEYEIGWQDFLDWPIAKSTFKVQVTPFNASNTNCQTCDEITQLELVDDTTADVFDEGTTNEFPFSVLDNDGICCYPFVISISSYNTTYFSSVTIADDGTVTFTVNDEVPNLANVLLATYRVTCPNGAYDEADIFVGIQGTSSECIAPANVVAELPPSDGSIATIIWDPVLPTPAGYTWVLYAADDIYTPIDSGTTTDNFVNLTGLTPGDAYVFTVQTDCGAYDFSEVSQLYFTTPNIDINNCGDFTVTHINSETPQVSYYSYMDCVGDIHNESTTGATQVNHCMMMNPDTLEPTFFTTTSTYISITYIGIC